MCLGDSTVFILYGIPQFVFSFKFVFSVYCNYIYFTILILKYDTEQGRKVYWFSADQEYPPDAYKNQCSFLLQLLNGFVPFQHKQTYRYEMVCLSGQALSRAYK